MSATYYILAGVCWTKEIRDLKSSLLLSPPGILDIGEVHENTEDKQIIWQGCEEFFAKKNDTLRNFMKMTAERNHSENHKGRNSGRVLRVNQRWGGKGHSLQEKLIVRMREWGRYSGVGMCVREPTRWFGAGESSSGKLEGGRGWRIQVREDMKTLCLFEHGQYHARLVIEHSAPCSTGEVYIRWCLLD